MIFDGRRYRPMGTTDLFDEAFDLYKKNFGLLMTITAVVYVPAVGILSHYFSGWISGYLSSVNSSNGPDFGEMFAYFGNSISTIALVVPPYALIAGLLIGALSAAISARYHYEPITLKQSFQKGAIAAIPVALLMVIWGLLIAVGLMSCIVPGLILILFSSIHILAGQASVDERITNVARAATRSKRLTTGEISRIIGAMILLTFLAASVLGSVYGVFMALMGLLVQSALPFMPLLEAHQDVASQIALNLTGMMLVPFAAIVVSLLYYDMRIRSEGYDMEVLARTLGYPSVVMPEPARPNTLPKKVNKPKKAGQT